MASIPYRSAIGSLMYLAVCMRPDISATVSCLSRFNHNPGMAHWEGVQHVLRYLRGTSGEGMCFTKGVSIALYGVTATPAILLARTPPAPELHL